MQLNNEDTCFRRINLCIPRIETNDTKYIRGIFQKLNFGKIGKIDCVAAGHDGKYFKAFVHYKNWYNTEQNKKILDRLNCQKLVAIVHSCPWYWRIRLVR